jgi:hypothetical protein
MIFYRMIPNHQGSLHKNCQWLIHKFHEDIDFDLIINNSMEWKLVAFLLLLSCFLQADTAFQQ